MIHVIATIQLKPGTRDEFLRHFRAIVPLVYEEAGCLEYGPTVDIPTNLVAQPAPREDVVTVIERWESVAALESHLVAAHMLTYRQRVKDLVESVALQILVPV